MEATSPRDRLASMIAKMAPSEGTEPEVPMPDLSQESDPLQRLSIMVRVAQNRTRMGKLTKDMEVAAQQVRDCEARLLEARRRAKEERPEHDASLAKVEKEESKLKDLIRQVATLRASLSVADQRTFDAEIESARRDLTQRRSTAEAVVSEIAKEFDEATAAVKEAIAKYADIRSQVAMVDKSHLQKYEDVDYILVHMEQNNPASQARMLHQEIDEKAPEFDFINQPERTKVVYQQLRVWVGRARKLQDQFATSGGQLNADDWECLKHLFPRLIDLSRHYRPGYIECLERAFDIARSEFGNWDTYIEDAQVKLAQVMEQVRKSAPLKGGRY